MVKIESQLRLGFNFFYIEKKTFKRFSPIEISRCGQSGRGEGWREHFFVFFFALKLLKAIGGKNESFAY